MTARRFRERRDPPPIILAIQYTGYKKSVDEIVYELGPLHRVETRGNDFHDIVCWFWVETPAGEIKVDEGDWVVVDAKDGFSVMSDDFFNELYEAVYD